METKIKRYIQTYKAAHIKAHAVLEELLDHLEKMQLEAEALQNLQIVSIGDIPDASVYIINGVERIEITSQFYDMVINHFQPDTETTISTSKGRKFNVIIETVENNESKEMEEI